MNLFKSLLFLHGHIVDPALLEDAEVATPVPGIAPERADGARPAPAPLPGYALSRVSWA